MSPLIRTRLAQAARILVWILLGYLLLAGAVFVGLRIHAATHPQTARDPRPVTAHPAALAPVVPPGAQHIATLYAFQWLSVWAGATPQQWADALSTYATPRYASQLHHQAPGTWTWPKPAKKSANPTSPLLAVSTAYVWATHWITPGHVATVTVRVQTTDGTLWYLAIPVQHIGQAWLVAGEPALVGTPAVGHQSRKIPPALSSATQQGIQSTLSPFFSAYLTGQSQTASRYTVQPISAVNVAGQITGTVSGVAFQAVSGPGIRPVEVDAYVAVATHATTLDFQYRVQLAQHHGEWQIVHVTPY